MVLVYSVFDHAMRGIPDANGSDLEQRMMICHSKVIVPQDHVPASIGRASALRKKILDASCCESFSESVLPSRNMHV